VQVLELVQGYVRPRGKVERLSNTCQLKHEPKQHEVNVHSNGKVGDTLMDTLTGLTTFDSMLLAGDLPT
jgi:hypothetical protein